MDLIAQFIDVILHLDRHLALLVENYGVWIYAILFLIVFSETGLVVTPFLPGDSLLFVAGTLAAVGDMDVRILIVLLIAAAILGDTVNYAVGKWSGTRLLASRWIKGDHIARTHAFFERHGGKTIVLARFVPIVRTFAPFVAGLGAMSYRRFLAYNVGGAVAWVVIFVGGGYWFGNLPIVKQNLSLILLGIIVLSVAPLAWEIVRSRRAR